MFRALPEGHPLKVIANSGQFVSDEDTEGLIKENMSPTSNYVLDGFPRNLSQISIYEDICRSSNLKNIVVVLDIPREVGEKRITGRRVCPECGSVYNENIEESKPKVLGVCDECGHKLNHRDDDS